MAWGGSEEVAASEHFIECFPKFGALFGSPCKRIMEAPISSCRVEEVGLWIWGGLCCLSFFRLFWDQTTVVFQLST